MRQGAPLTAGPQQIEDGIDDRAQVALARPPEPTRGRQQRRNLRPLPKPGIACIAQLVTPILLPSGFSPHVVPPSLSANKTESHMTEITQFIFGQPLRMRFFLNAIKNLPHPEERPAGASRRTHDVGPMSLSPTESLLVPDAPALVVGLNPHLLVEGVELGG